MELNNIQSEHFKIGNECERINLDKINICNFLKELSERIEKMQDILVIDRIEGEYAICENRQTKEMIDINLQDLPQGIKEGTVLKWNNGKYEIDIEEQKSIEDRIKQKMDNLWNN